MEPRPHPVSPDGAPIEALLERIEWQRRVVDRRLSNPASWRGPLRRELTGRPAPDERSRVAAAFSWMIKSAQTGQPLDVPLLLEAHDRASGGARFRSNWIRVGRHRLYSPPRDIAPQTEALLARLRDSSEPAALLAARLHFDLVKIHPFSDGNGRTVRLLAAFLLVRAGYRSTLLTAVEQHSLANPSSYLRTFSDFAADRRAPDAWIRYALKNMVRQSSWVAWFRERQERLRNGGRALGLASHDLERALIEFDFGSGDASGLTAALARSERRWLEIRRELPQQTCIQLEWQLQRLRDEEKPANEETR